MDREYLFEFRRDFEAGAIKFKNGDLFWSKVKPIVQQGVECFRMQLEKWNPRFQEAFDYHKKMLGGDWDGHFEIPCSFVRFNEDLEDELQHVHESVVEDWKTAFHRKQENRS